MSGENGRKKMETQFYEDSHNPWMSKKKCMTLDLDTGKRKPAVLSTPDVQMLKLASPELEKMIISQQQGNICTTPTPTQFICPKNVTEEQAAFAQGFVEALQSLHQRNDTNSGDSESVLSDDDGSTTTGDQSDLGPTTTYQQAILPQTTISSMTTAPTSIFNPAMPTTTTLPGSTVSASLTTRDSMPPVGVDTSAISGGWRVDIKQEPVCEEPQTVPVFHPSNPPMSPIDMETQERIKAERKRLRNRIAASKCRKRKLERIARLEDKVKDLKSQNSDLTATATKLREQVCALKQSVMEHVKSGCQVMLAQQLAF